jgi:hypothetical protein
MTQIPFDTGTLIGKRLDLPGQPPSLLGILSGVTLTFERKIFTTTGGMAGAAIAAASGEMTVKGNAKFARLQATSIGNMFFGPNTLQMPGNLQMTVGENQTVPLGSSLEITVNQAATFIEDLGVFYAETGAALTPVSNGDPGPTEYQSLPGGIYLFNDHDEGTAVTIYYTYTTSTGQQLIIADAGGGAMPFFQVFLRQPDSALGLGFDVVTKLTNCFSSKLALPFTTQRYSIADFEFQAMLDPTNTIALMGLVQ